MLFLSILWIVKVNATPYDDSRLTPQNIVRLNASNFCSVAFTLTNLRLLCQVT